MAGGSAMDDLVEEILRGSDANLLVQEHRKLCAAGNPRMRATLAIVVAAGLSVAGYCGWQVHDLWDWGFRWTHVVGLLGGMLVAWAAAGLALAENLMHLENLPKVRKRQVLVDLWTSGFRMTDLTQCAVAYSAPWRALHWIFPVPVILLTLFLPFLFFSIVNPGHLAERCFYAYHLALPVLCAAAILWRRRGYRILFAMLVAEGIVCRLEFLLGGPLKRSRADGGMALLPSYAPPVAGVLHLALMVFLNPEFHMAPIIPILGNPALLAIPLYLALTPNASPAALRARWERHHSEWNPRFDTVMRRLLGDPD